jgi:hypothetical protein
MPHDTTGQAARPTNVRTCPAPDRGVTTAPGRQFSLTGPHLLTGQALSLTGSTP